MIRPDVVPDASVLRRLIEFPDIMELLPLVWGRIRLSSAVAAELGSQPGRLRSRWKNYMRGSRGFVVPCPDVDELVFGELEGDSRVHAGERHVIAQAAKTGSDVLMDDNDAIHAARELAGRLQLEVFRTGRLLVELKARGALETVRPHLEALRDRHGMFLSPGAFLEILELAKES
jgi:predicted nucleic acid-binding protein